MTQIAVFHQVVPEQFAQKLRHLHAAGHPDLNAVLCAAHNSGWTLSSLGRALGMTRTAVWLRVHKARPTSWFVAIPDPPLKPPPSPKPERRQPKRVSPEVAQLLRGMQAEARSVNGGTAADDPRREVAVQLAALLAGLVDEGYSLNHLARVLGVTYDAVKFRLARHGYRQAPPSQAHQVYRGAPSYRKETHCGRGHPMSNSNVWVSPDGKRRACRGCNRVRYAERKQVAAR